MRHEKIIKRPDGTRYKITVTCNEYREEFNWYFTCEVSQPGKKKFNPVYNNDSTEYRQLSMDKREAYATAKTYQFVTHDEVATTARELWNKLKPSPFLNAR
jgi:hypothetical protein